MSTEKMREEFEGAYVRDLVGNSLSSACEWLERGSDGEYRSFQARGAWWAWQASREAIEVELPREDRNIDYSGYISKSETEAAIESLGLKVKPC